MPTNMHCQQCGKDFTCTNREAKGGRKFCSMVCYRAHEEAHGRPRPDVVVTTFNCKTCGKPFSRNAGELRSYHKQFGKDPMYCSIPCSAVGRKADKDEAWDRKCVQCGGAIPLTRNESGRNIARVRICSSDCRKAFKLAEHERLRPSDTREVQRNITRQGYIRLRFPNQNGVKGREVLEHRYVMEQVIGRLLRPDETVHHRVKPTTNNAPENLELFSSRHGPGQRVTEQVDWAVQILTDYADFAQKAGFKLVKIE